MRIHTKQIPPEGLRLQGVLAPEDIGLTEDDGLWLTAPVRIKVLMTRSENSFLAQVTAGSRYTSSCGRCLQEVTRDWTADFTIDLESLAACPPDSSERGKENLTQTGDQKADSLKPKKERRDQEDGADPLAEVIDIDQDIRQEIILNLPMKILCRDDCKGLCPDCGADLNKQECQGHQAAPVNAGRTT